jgi:hypothetical protein
MNGHIVHFPDDMSLESDGGIILTGETEELAEKPVPVPLCPPQIVHTDSPGGGEFGPPR